MYYVYGELIDLSVDEYFLSVGEGGSYMHTT